jgi:hypothetical protein
LTAGVSSTSGGGVTTHVFASLGASGFGGGGLGVSRNAVDRAGSERDDSSVVGALHKVANLLSTFEGAGFVGKAYDGVTFPWSCRGGPEFEFRRTWRDGRDGSVLCFSFRFSNVPIHH